MAWRSRLHVVLCGGFLLAGCDPNDPPPINGGVCQAGSGSFDPALLPAVSEPYAPLTYGMNAKRLAKDSYLLGLVPSISAFAFFIENGAGAATGQSYRSTMLSNLDVATFRAMTFPAGTPSIAEPSFANPYAGTGEHPVRAVWAMYDKDNPALEDPEDAECVVKDFLDAYKGGHKPSAVVERLLKTMEKEGTGPYSAWNTEPENHGLFHSKPTDLIKMTLRGDGEYHDNEWETGVTAPLEGVPFAVKAQFQVAGFPQSVGTRWRATPVDSGPSAEVVRPLQSMGGGIAIGNTSMHELGGGVTGVNPHYGAARNAYSKELAAGGSSGGVAALVAMHATPFGVASDAGGSTRIPASNNGVYGLKPTYGSMSNVGNFPLATSLTQPGPVARTVRDLWAAAIMMSGNRHYWTGPPSTDLSSYNGPGRPLIVGVHYGWIEQSNAEMRAAFEQGIAQLQGAGAVVVQIDPPGKGIEKLPWAGRAQIVRYITSLSAVVPVAARTEISPEQRIALKMGELQPAVTNHGLNANDIAQVNKIRGALTTAVEQIFCSGVDVIATPTTGIGPVPIRGAGYAGNGGSAFPDGESDIVELDAIAKFATLANLTGHPAITIPVTKHGGLQLIGRPHSEKGLLTAAYAYEQIAGWHNAKPVKDLCPLDRLPIIAISTVDSSVNYTQLCVFETSTGAVPTYGSSSGYPECDYQTNYQLSDGTCVRSPLAGDRAKYNADRQQFIDDIDDAFPVASAIISGTGYCWAGTKASVITAGEADPEDSFGPMSFRVGGTSRTNRITLADLQETFRQQWKKHGLKDDLETANDADEDKTRKDTEAVLLFDVDNSGSISVSQWPSTIRTEFETWVRTEYPKVEIRATVISNYQVDGEDWIRRQHDAYKKLVEEKKKEDEEEQPQM